MKQKDRIAAHAYHAGMAARIAAEEAIVIKYRIRGCIFRRRYTIAQADEARRRVQLYRDNGVEVISVKGLPQ